MSVSESQLAGNYAMSGGSGDAAFVGERLAEMHDEATERRVETADHEDTRYHVEQAGDGDTLGTLTVDGDDIPLERSLTDVLGMGHVARIEAQERDRSREFAQSVVALIDALDECTGESYDAEYWFDLSNAALGSAYTQALSLSRGGERAGE